MSEREARPRWRLPLLRPAARRAARWRGRNAVRYARVGWPLVAGAWWDGGRYRCAEPRCPDEHLHRSGHGLAEAAEARTVAELAGWPALPYTLLLSTGSGVDVLELPARAASAVSVLGVEPGTVRVPVARLPAGRWLLFGAGTDRSATVAAAAHRAGVVHHGSGSYVPLPPSVLQHGAVRWMVPPDVDSAPDGLVPVERLLERVLPSLPSVPAVAADAPRFGLDPL